MKRLARYAARTEEMNRKPTVVATIFIGIYFFTGCCLPAYGASSLTGITGLITTPNANVVSNGQFVSGFTWIGSAASFMRSPKYPNRLYYASMGIVQDMELSFRLTEAVGRVDPVVQPLFYEIDRIGSVKYHLPLKIQHIESAIGIQDVGSVNVLANKPAIFGSSQRDLTIYGVTTFLWVENEFSLGYASAKPFPETHTFSGLFYGAELKPCHWVTLTGEYDGEYTNIGFRLKPISSLQLYINRMNWQDWSFGGSVQFSL